MSSTLGKTATPNTGTHGWFGFSSHPQVAMLFTVPSPGALITDISFWAAGASAMTIHGVVWDSSGNVLAFGPGVSTSGGGAGGVGATTWYTDTLSSPVFVAAGTDIYIGWQREASSGTVYWAYNGSDHSPNAEWHGSYGSSGQSFSGHTQMNSSGNVGAVAAYITYTPAGGIKITTDGSTWHKHPVKVSDGSNWIWRPLKTSDGSVWTRRG